MKLIVIDESISQGSLEYLNIVCIENKIPLLITNNFTSTLNLSKFYQPINIKPQLNVFLASGDLVSIKSLDVKQIERNIKFKNYENCDDKNTQICSCCEIF